MRKVHEKSVILGIGIGMIITAIAGMIFSAGTTKELSKQEIISIAKSKYGLVEKIPFLNYNSEASEVSSSSDSNTTKSTDSNAD